MADCLGFTSVSDKEPKHGIARQEPLNRQSQRILEAAPNGMVMADHNGRIAFVNKAMEQMFGYAREELINQPVELLVPERIRREHSDYVRDFLARPMMRPMGAGRELFGRRKDGSEFPVEIGLSPLEVDVGTFALASVVDITERKKMVEVIRDAHVRLQAALEAGSMGSWVWDLRNQNIWWDEATSKLLGRKPEVLADKVIETFVSFLHPEDQDNVKQALQNCLDKGSDYDVEYRLIRPDGTWIWLAARGRMELDNNGRPWRLTGACVDITRRKRIEQQRVHDTLDLERSNRELQQFAYIASHDLREPLRMVANYTQLLFEDYNEKLDESGRKYIRYAQDGARRMIQLIDDLLNYSRVGRKDDPPEPVQLNEVLKQVLFDLDQTIRESGGVLELADLPSVFGNSVGLHQLFQNLISNALKFRGPEPPRIEVRFRTRGEMHQITVTDNGIGIDPKFKERIFQIFQRLHSRQEYPGNGIGLAICKKIVEQHGGQIWVESQVGQGTSFHFTLPAVQASAAIPSLERTMYGLHTPIWSTV